MLEAEQPPQTTDQPPRELIYRSSFYTSDNQLAMAMICNYLLVNKNAGRETILVASEMMLRKYRKMKAPARLITHERVTALTVTNDTAIVIDRPGPTKKFFDWLRYQLGSDVNSKAFWAARIDQLLRDNSSEFAVAYYEQLQAYGFIHRNV